jgi:hypothetical protein
MQNNFKLFIERPEEEHDICLHMDVSIEGPGHSEVNTKNFGNGTIGVSYRVAIPGKYIIRITFQGMDVAGSPFHVLVK